MNSNQEKIIELLVQTATEHRAFEEATMDGVHDENWNHWYSKYLLENGLKEVLTQEFGEEDLAEFFLASFARFQEEEPEENWRTFTAAEMLQQFG